MRRIQLLRVACLLPVLAGLFAAGCAEVVPGLNRPDVDEGVHVLEAPAPGGVLAGEWPPYGPRTVPAPP